MSALLRSSNVIIQTIQRPLEEPTVGLPDGGHDGFGNAQFFRFGTRAVVGLVGFDQLAVVEVAGVALGGPAPPAQDVGGEGIVDLPEGDRHRWEEDGRAARAGGRHGDCTT